MGMIPAKNTFLGKGMIRSFRISKIRFLFFSFLFLYLFILPFFQTIKIFVLHPILFFYQKSFTRTKVLNLKILFSLFVFLKFVLYRRNSKRKLVFRIEIIIVGEHNKFISALFYRSNRCNCSRCTKHTTLSSPTTLSKKREKEYALENT